jgi:hypothetical protein
MCFKQRRTINIVPFQKMADQAGISRTFELVIRDRAKSRFARHDLEPDGSIPRRGCELNLAFRKLKALRIVRAMEGAPGQAVPKVRRVFKALPADRACNATMSERRA